MKCPNCQKQMKVHRSITGHWFGDLVIGEALFWLFILPLIFLGIIGFIIIGLIIVVLIAISWGKLWYKCKECGYSAVILINKK